MDGPFFEKAIVCPLFSDCPCLIELQILLLSFKLYALVSC